MSLDLVTLALAKKYTDDADARTDEQIAQAVADYLEENPIEVPKPDLTGVVKSVNGKTPDENGNVEITIPDSSQNGDDGFSPVATVEQTTDGAVITITDKDGTTTATITNGKDGKDGADGQPGKDGADGAPGEKGDKGDKGDPGQKGEQGIPGEKGEKGDTGATGAQGEPGKDGANGKDGTSATHSWNGTVLTITSASGTSSADLKGDKGDTGSAGKDGKTPVKGVDYYTDADKAEIINAVLAALGGSPVSGYVDADNNIVISAELADGTYTIKYENADGTYTEIGAFEVGAIGPAYTNLFDSESAELNKRWSNSSYGFSDTNGYVVSDFIPVSVSSDASNPTVLRFRGGTMAGKASIVYYNSDKALLADPNQSTAGADCGASRMEVTTDANGDYQISLGYKSGAFVSTWANAGYIRVCLEINSTATAITKNDIQNIIITIDEPITD